MGITHISFNLCTRSQGSHGINHDNIYSGTTHQHLYNFQGLFTGIGLRDQKLIYIYAQFSA